MDEAVSTYLGGATIKAAQCDYSSFEQLGLKCPYCNAPVILVDEFGRLAPKNKHIAIVPRFFRHTQAVDKARAAECKARSLSEEGREHLRKLATQARGQRLQKFQRRFWSMVTQSYKVAHWLKNRETFAAQMNISTLTEAEILNEYLGEFQDILKSSLAGGGFQKALREWAAQLYDENFVKPPGYSNLLVTESLDRLRATLNIEYQAMVAIEAAYYLATPTGRGALGELFLCGFTYSSSKLNEEYRRLDHEILKGVTLPGWAAGLAVGGGLKEKKRQILYDEVAADLVAVLITVPWAEALNNLTPTNAAIAKEARSQK